jgi:DNA-binding transcriptional regulator YiaG
MNGTMSPKQVVAIRKTLGITQQELADRIAAHQVSVARWKTGQSVPTGAYLKALNELAAKLKRRRKGV